jgi:hypothetical protein
LRPIEKDHERLLFGDKSILFQLVKIPKKATKIQWGNVIARPKKDKSNIGEDSP